MRIATKSSVFLALLSAWLAIPAQAQTAGTAITIPGGQIYQAAAQGGIDYISPAVATAIVMQKAGLNWKSIGVQVLTDGSIAAVTAGLGGVVAISKPVLTGLAAGHAFADQIVEPILQTAAPSGLANLAPVLQVTGSLVVTSGTCAEGTIFASQFSVSGSKVSAKKAMAKKATAPLPSAVTLTMQGATVTLTPQTSTVLKNAAGSTIDQFIPVDVLACPQANVAPAVVTSPVTTLPTPGIGASVAPAPIEYDATVLAKVLAAREAGMAVAAQVEAVQETAAPDGRALAAANEDPLPIYPSGSLSAKLPGSRTGAVP